MTGCWRDTCVRVRSPQTTQSSDRGSPETWKSSRSLFPPCSLVQSKQHHGVWRTVRSYSLAQRFSSANVSQKRRVTHPTMLFTHACKTDLIAAQRRDHVIFTSLTPPLPKTATRQALFRHSRIVAALSWPLRSLPHVVSLRAGGRGRRECEYHQPAEKRVRRKKHR